MHLKASSYFTDPESGTSRAWDKFRKQLQAEYHIQSEPSAAAARAFHFRLPGHPLWTMDSSKLTRAGALLQIPAEIATSVTASAAAAALRGERIPPMQVKEEQQREQVETEGQVVSGTSAKLYLAPHAPGRPSLRACIRTHTYTYTNT
jgi:hypothetical protein